jgi:hypothetical protein
MPEPPRRQVRDDRDDRPDPAAATAIDKPRNRVTRQSRILENFRNQTGVTCQALASQVLEGSPVAPRPYFPSDVSGGRVTRPSQGPARRAELSDLLQYYLYGYKHPTPEAGSVFGQVTIPATTIVNFTAVFDFTTFTVELAAGSYTLNLSTFVISPVMSFPAVDTAGNTIGGPVRLRAVHR